jgi:hypothetical protein
MIDSGCNTHLLPMDENTLDDLVHYYSGAEFGWSIRTSGGVGAFASLVLVITASCPMMTNLFADLFKLSVKLDHLRFHISLQDARDIISRKPKRVIEADILSLEKFCEVAQWIQQKTGVEIGKRRSYALLGQSVMKQDFDVIQTPYITMFVHESDKMDWCSAKDIARCLWERFRIEFESNEELQTMEDFDHDGEDVLGWIVE